MSKLATCLLAFSVLSLTTLGFADKKADKAGEKKAEAKKAGEKKAEAKKADGKKGAKKDHKISKARIAAQGICPVGGGKLGEKGEPLVAKFGDKQLLVCCKGCVGAEAKEEHLKTIMANLLKAQPNCVVKGAKLGENPKTVIANGRVVFVCCPGCAGKVKADPKTYVKKVNQQNQAAIAKGNKGKKKEGKKEASN